jgi:hypothetical protein
MKKYLAIISLITLTLLCLIFIPRDIDALELLRQKNTNTVIVFPIIDVDGAPLSSVGTTDTEVDTFADGTNPDGFADMTEPTEVGATGIYYIAMTTAELNFEYLIIRVAASTSEAITQHILVRTMVGDHANLASSDDGGAFNVASGVVEANVEQIADDAVADGADGLLDVNIKEVGDDDIVDNADGRLEVNLEEIADTAVSATAAQLGVNVVWYGGTTAESTVSGLPDVNITYWEDDAVPATADGYPAVNVDEWDDTDVATAVAGKPEVNVTHWEDSAITDADDDPDVDVVSMGNNVITSASINDGGITDADVADAVQVDVKTIETVDATDALDTAANTVTVTSIGANVITDASMAGDVDTLVNDEIVDVLKTDTVTEMGTGAPPATPTFEQILNFIYRAFRNKTTTDTAEIKYYADEPSETRQQRIRLRLSITPMMAQRLILSRLSVTMGRLLQRVR